MRLKDQLFYEFFDSLFEKKNSKTKYKGVRKKSCATLLLLICMVGSGPLIYKTNQTVLHEKINIS